MNPSLAAALAVASLVTPLAFFVWLRAWMPARFRRLVSGGALLVDVGTAKEYAEGHLDGAVNVPYGELALRQIELGEHRRPIITYARSRLRGAQAAQTLRGIGFHDVFNVGTLTSVKVWAASPPPDAAGAGAVGPYGM